jgi:hypothetical protein
MKANISKVWITSIFLVLLLAVNISTASNLINLKNSNLATQLRDHTSYHQVLKDINTKTIISISKKQISNYKNYTNNFTLNSTSNNTLNYSNNTLNYSNNSKFHIKDSGYIDYASTYHVILEPGETKTIYFSTIPYDPATCMGYKLNELPSFIHQFVYPVDNGIWLFAAKYTADGPTKVKFGNYNSSYYFCVDFVNFTIEISIVNYRTTPAILRMLNLTV